MARASFSSSRRHATRWSAAALRRSQDLAGRDNRPARAHGFTRRAARLKRTAGVQDLRRVPHPGTAKPRTAPRARVLARSTIRPIAFASLNSAACGGPGYTTHGTRGGVRRTPEDRRALAASVQRGPQPQERGRASAGRCTSPDCEGRSRRAARGQAVRRPVCRRGCAPRRRGSAACALSPHLAIYPLQDLASNLIPVRPPSTARRACPPPMAALDAAAAGGPASRTASSAGPRVRRGTGVLRYRAFSSAGARREEFSFILAQRDTNRDHPYARDHAHRVTCVSRETFCALRHNPARPASHHRSVCRPLLPSATPPILPSGPLHPALYDRFDQH